MTSVRAPGLCAAGSAASKSKPTWPSAKKKKRSSAQSRSEETLMPLWVSCVPSPSALVQLLDVLHQHRDPGLQLIAVLQPADGAADARHVLRGKPDQRDVVRSRKHGVVPLRAAAAAAGDVVDPRNAGD